jgi:hypothetical protein
MTNHETATDRRPAHTGHKRKAPAESTAGAGHTGARLAYFALSITSWVQAPSGALVMTGSEPPDIKVFTVRS